MRDDFTEDVKRVLANRVGHECSNPDCRASTSGPQADSTKALNLGVAAHITAASPRGPRFDQSLAGGPALSSPAQNTKWVPHSSRFLRRVGSMRLAAPGLASSRISWHRQHRIRPCKKRKSGAPALLMEGHFTHPQFRVDLFFSKSAT